jgi:hypothetical protein
MVVLGKYTEQQYSLSNKLLAFYQAIGYFLTKHCDYFSNVLSEEFDDYGVKVYNEADCMTLASELGSDNNNYHQEENELSAFKLMKQVDERIFTESVMFNSKEYCTKFSSNVSPRRNNTESPFLDYSQPSYVNRK